MDQILLPSSCCPDQLLHQAGSGFFGGVTGVLGLLQHYFCMCCSVPAALSLHNSSAPGHPQGHHLHSGERAEGDTVINNSGLLPFAVILTFANYFGIVQFVITFELLLI